jgi:hypothetical protein
MKNIINDSIKISNPITMGLAMDKIDWKRITGRMIRVHYNYDENGQVKSGATRMVVPEHQTTADVIQHIMTEISK